MMSRQVHLAAVLSSFALLNHQVAGHGYFTLPKSRTAIAEEKGADQCANCIINEGSQIIGWPHVGESPVGRTGPCGYKPGGDVDYNKPDAKGVWGNAPVAVYTEGDVIDVWWCVMNSADHAGMYSYRICTDDALVSKFTDVNYLPTLAEKQQLEDCFQRGILPCAGVSSNDCSKHDHTNGGSFSAISDTLWSNWFSCFDHTSSTKCAGSASRPNKYVNQSTPPSCHNGAGTSLNDKVRLPTGFNSKHTLLSWRWDCQQTKQVWLGCADIQINPLTIGGGGSSPGSSSTTAPITTPAPAGPICAASPSNVNNIKVDCGFLGITESGCLAKSCCWSPSTVDGEPWCYNSFVSATTATTTTAPAGSGQEGNVNNQPSGSASSSTNNNGAVVPAGSNLFLSSRGGLSMTGIILIVAIAILTVALGAYAVYRNKQAAAADGAYTNSNSKV